MALFKVDAEALAKVRGAEDQEKYPILTKLLGTGKDGSLSIQVSGESLAPVSARISGDHDNPIAIEPISVAPITIVPDLKMVMESIDLKGLLSSISKLAEGVSISVSNQNDKPILVSLGKIPVDLTISVYSPTQEQAFRVEIKGAVGGN
jgi:hypothetical protein